MQRQSESVPYERFKRKSDEAARWKERAEKAEGAAVLAEGLAALSRRFNRPIPVNLSRHADDLTAERAKEILAELAGQLEEGLL